VVFGLGDPHAGGRSGARIRFADGRAVAYKPRSLRAEIGVHRLQRWLARQEGGERHRIPRTITAPDHGWMEWVERSPCTSPAEAERLFRRAGSLLALLRSTAGGDIHSENLVCAGEWPVLVDAECLFQPLPGGGAPVDEDEAPRLFSTGLLPVFASHDGGNTFLDIGGLAPMETGRLTPIPGWAHVGTDWMRPARVQTPLPSAGIPPLSEGGALLRPEDFADALVEGFAATLSLLLRERHALVGPRGTLMALRRAEARWLAAPTQAYARVLEARAAAGGLSETPAGERLRNRPPLLPDRVWQRVLEAEARCLREMDVPRFTFRPGSRLLRDAHGRRLGFAWTEPPFVSVRQDLESLGPEAIDREVRLLRAVYRGAELPRPTGMERKRDANEPGAAPPSRDRLRTAMEGVMDRIAGAAVQAPDGSVDWIRVGMELPWMPRPAEVGLGYGTTGIGLVLARAARQCDRTEWATLARQCFVRLERRAEGGRLRATAARAGAGQGRGIGGIVSGLVAAAKVLEDPALLDLAAVVAQSATVPSPGGTRGEGTGAADLHDGAAGLLLGLAALHAERPSSAWVDGMRRCGEVIEAVASGPVPSGLAHGASGMALAAAALGRDAGEERWLRLATALLRKEEAAFDPGRGRWADPLPSTSRGGGGPGSGCRGAPGIARVRHALLHLDLPALSELPLAAELNGALRAARSTPVEDADDRCCGEAGRLTALWMCGGAEDHAEAQRSLAGRLADWEAGSVRLWSSELERMPADPSLLKGTAGIAALLLLVCEGHEAWAEGRPLHGLPSDSMLL
jgi:type 2 lantibiotic biosynthesis protein LanM